MANSRVKHKKETQRKYARILNVFCSIRILVIFEKKYFIRLGMIFKLLHLALIQLTLFRVTLFEASGKQPCPERKKFRHFDNIAVEFIRVSHRY